VRGKHEKIGFDSTAGWLGYLSKEGQLLIKRFPVAPERPYGEMVVRTLNHTALDRPHKSSVLKLVDMSMCAGQGLTCCVFYYRDRLVELEPIGPLETLAPGAEACFTETWSLFPFAFPDEGQSVDYAAVTAAVDRLDPPRL
jgi:hypothetical protein